MDAYVDINQKEYPMQMRGNVSENKEDSMQLNGHGAKLKAE